MTTLDDERRAAGLSPLPQQTTNEDEEQQDVETEDATIGNEERLRGIPAVGRVSGTIKGTRPGDLVSALEAEAKELNERGRRIVNRHRFKRPRG